jgi:molybdopterin converting factor small subunit
MHQVTLRYWAAAKEAAGVAEEAVEATTLAEALEAAGRRHAETARFAQVLRRSSYVVNGDPVGRREPESVSLADGATVEVLPPFAGG